MNDGAEIVETERDPLIGARVGAYLVDALIGEGGMGRVYKAHHAHLAHRRCALKVLIGDYSAVPAMRIRFAREAENASRLSHPNIASVFDFGRTDGGLMYIAMELVEGRSLDDLVSSTPMEPTRVLALARQLCEALAHAHAIGLVHRDFKPDNILVVDGPDGEIPKVVDFGIAIAADSSNPRMTSTGIVMGTPAYVAPEQCVTNGEADERSDLYALGVTLYELLSGGFLPFDGESAEIVGRKVAADPPSVSKRVADLPIAVVALVDRLLARKPEHRFQTANEVIAAIDAVVKDPAKATPRSRRNDDTVLEGSGRLKKTGQRTQFVRSSRTSKLIGGALGVVGVGAAIASAVMWQQAKSTDGPGSPDLIAAAAPVAPLPATTPPPAATPPISQPPTSGVDDTVELIPKATHPPTNERAPRKSRPQSGVRPPRAGRVERQPTAPPVTAPPVSLPEPPKPSEPPPTPPPPPTPLRVSIGALVVDGGLSRAAVQRAVDRVMPNLEACRVVQPGVVDVQFRIGESRRASQTTARGISPAVSQCVAGAFGGLRTETASDVGDVEVRVKVAFGAGG